MHEPEARALTVVIAVGEPLVAQGMRSILEAATPGPVSVSAVTDAASLFERLGEDAADVCILDGGLSPGESDPGDLIAGVHKRRGDCRVLLLARQPVLGGVLSAFEMGAAGVLVREDDVDLLAAAHAVAGGLTVMSGRALETIMAPRGPRAACPPGGGVEELTPRELEVLRWLAAGSSNREIAAELTLSERTVKTHVGHIFAKLDVRDRAQAVVAAFSAGVALPPPGEEPAS